MASVRSYILEQHHTLRLYISRPGLVLRCLSRRQNKHGIVTDNSAPENLQRAALAKIAVCMCLLWHQVVLCLYLSMRSCATCPPELADPILHDAVQFSGPEGEERSKVCFTSNVSGLTPCSKSAAEERLAPSREIFSSRSAGAVRYTSINPTFYGDAADDKESLEENSGQYDGTYDYTSRCPYRMPADPHRDDGQRECHHRKEGRAAFTGTRLAPCLSERHVSLGLWVLSEALRLFIFDAEDFTWDYARSPRGEPRVMQLDADSRECFALHVESMASVVDSSMTQQRLCRESSLSYRWMRTVLMQLHCLSKGCIYRDLASFGREPVIEPAWTMESLMLRAVRGIGRWE